MNATLLTAGLACVIAGVIGGGLKAWGIEIPALQSIRRQLALILVGVVLVGLSGAVGKSPSPSAAGTGTPQSNSGSAQSPLAGADQAHHQAKDQTQVTVFDHVGDDQVWETISLTLGNAPEQHMTVSHSNQAAFLTFSVPATRDVSYTLKQAQQPRVQPGMLSDTGTGVIHPLTVTRYAVDGGTVNGVHSIFLKPLP